MLYIKLQLTAIIEVPSCISKTLADTLQATMDLYPQAAMNELSQQMAQMRNQAIGETSDHILELLDNIADKILKHYIVLDRQTNVAVQLSDHNLLMMIDNDAWGQWQLGLTELLRFNDDVTWDRMDTLLDTLLSQQASDQLAPTNQPAQHQSIPVRPAGAPIGRTQSINVLERLYQTSFRQQAVLRSAIDYLRTVPEVVDPNTAVLEGQAIASVKNLVHAQWGEESRRAHQDFSLLMQAQSIGVNGSAVGTIQGQLTWLNL